MNTKKPFAHKLGWLILLIPLVLFVRCDKDVTVRVVAAYNRPLSDASVSITHTEHQLVKEGHFFYSKTHNLTGETDSNGLITFSNQPFSVYDWIAFHFRKIKIEASKEDASARKCCRFFFHRSDLPYCIRLNSSQRRKEDPNTVEEEEKEKEYKIIIVSYCQDRNFNIQPAILALQLKGFLVYEVRPRTLGDWNCLRMSLDGDNCQLWIISDRVPHMTSEEYNIVYEYFRKGRGLFVWSDNDPYFADANVILDSLFASEMSGDYIGERTLQKQRETERQGIVEHTITTNLDYLYEGTTISHVRMTDELKPLVFSSDGNVVTAYYDKDGRRALIDGGFTRLFVNWDANTADFIVNCAYWLARRKE